jgi:hypothetical protein
MGLSLIDIVSMQDTCFANPQRIQRRERSWWTCSGSLWDRNKAYFFFSALWLTRMAEPKAPRPTCSMISYWSILDSMCSLSFPILCKWVQQFLGAVPSTFFLQLQDPGPIFFSGVKWVLTYLFPVFCPSSDLFAGVLHRLTADHESLSLYNTQLIFHRGLTFGKPRSPHW